MMIDKITEVTIFESPDGGKTVYARHPGSHVRELYSRDPKLVEQEKELKQQERWQYILAARQTNSAINELCEQAEILYELSKKAS
jgi:hypothetical protein